MSKIIIDTDIYIDFLRSGFFNDFVRSLYTFRRQNIFFSSVVIEELLQGTLDSKGKSFAEALFKPFEKVGRIVTPNHADWRETGNILANVRRQHLHYGNKSRGLINDALIALSTRRIGAILYSSNKKDFELLQKVRYFNFFPVEPEERAKRGKKARFLNVLRKVKNRKPDDGDEYS